MTLSRERISIALLIWHQDFESWCPMKCLTQKGNSIGKDNFYNTMTLENKLNDHTS